MASLHRHTELLKQPVCQLINWQSGSGCVLDCVFVWPFRGRELLLFQMCAPDLSRQVGVTLHTSLLTNTSQQEHHIVLNLHNLRETVIELSNSLHYCIWVFISLKIFLK